MQLLDNRVTIFITFLYQMAKQDGWQFAEDPNWANNWIGNPAMHGNQTPPR